MSILLKSISYKHGTDTDPSCYAINYVDGNDLSHKKSVNKLESISPAYQMIWDDLGKNIGIFLQTPNNNVLLESITISTKKNQFFLTFVVDYIQGGCHMKAKPQSPKQLDFFAEDNEIWSEISMQIKALNAEFVSSFL